MAQWVRARALATGFKPSGFKSSRLLTSWVNLVKLPNFSVPVPPSVYEDGGDKSASGVSVSTRNVLTYCKAFTAVPTPKVSLQALSFSRHRRDLSVLPPQFYKCGTETFKILPSEFFN